MNKKNKNIIYLGGAIPKNVEEEVSRIDEIPHVASQKFSWTVINSLKKEFDQIFNISSCDIRNYPVVNKLLFRFQFFKKNGVIGLFLGFVNILLLKHISRLLSLFVIVPWVILKYKINYMIVHGSHTPFMLIAILSKLLFDVRVAIILTDQHGRFVESDGSLGGILRSVDTRLMRLLLRLFDAHICLSPYFVSKFGLVNYFITPGILNEEFLNSIANNTSPTSKDSTFDIVYAGGVSVDNGVDRLLRAFMKLPYQNVRLIIYGSGPFVKDVEYSALHDLRINYGGVLYGNNYVKALLSANLLVNPRPISDEYAQSSFPSKLIEYMATGVPVLTTRLFAIPDEFKSCLFFIEDDSDNSIVNGLMKVINCSHVQREKIARLACERVCSICSETSFGMRTYELIS